MSHVDYAPVVEKPVDRKPPFAIKDSSFALSEQKYGVFSATLPVGVTLEEALRTEAWAHVCHMLQKQPYTGEAALTGAIIEVRTEDHAFYARLYVRAVQERGLVVSLIGEPEWFGPKEIKSKTYETRWNIGHKGYDIIRKSDREIVGDASKFPTREAAQNWIDKMIKDG